MQLKPDAITKILSSYLRYEKLHPGQQINHQQTEDKQVVDLRLDRAQEGVHGRQGQELSSTAGRRREGTDFSDLCTYKIYEREI